jgi:protein-L-isoaspartate(D-aspartate) O-methyltransferase
MSVVLQAMSMVPASTFLWLRRCDYAPTETIALPIACGQTISQPYIVARETELLEVTNEDRVLEIGAGSG